VSEHPIESDSSDQIIVTVEQADALLEMIASDENAGRISSAALSSGLVSLGLAGANGLAGRRVGADRGQESGGDAVGLGEELNEQVRGLDLGVAGRGGGLHGPGDRLLRLGGVVGVHADLLQR